MMTAERYQRIDPIFHLVLELDREAYRTSERVREWRRVMPLKIACA